MFANIFNNPFVQKEVFYDALEYQDIPVDEVFKAEYKYGPEEEQIIKKNILINFFQTLIARLFQSFVYPGASKKLDQQRILKTKHQLKSIGGKFLSLRTPDGDTLEGVHLKASDFKKSVEKYFYLYKEKNAPYNSLEKLLILRDKFCIKTRKRLWFSYTHVTPNEEAKKFIDLIEGLKFTNSYWGSMHWEQKLEPGNAILKTIDYLESFFIDKVRGYTLPFYSLAQRAPNLPTIDERISNPTVIISGGNEATYSSYKNLAVHYLMRGIDVMMVNPRGYGESTGIPTSHKTKLDLETAYQYLAKKQKVENKDLLVHGHCIGGGLATDLAARRKGVNLLLDRSFSTFEEQAKYIADDYFNNLKYTLETLFPKWKDFFENVLPDKYDEESTWGKIRHKITLLITEEHDIPKKLSNLIAKMVSWGISYNNTGNLEKIKGKIALIVDSNDGFIKKDAGRKQMNSCHERKIIVTNVGHSPSWISDDKSDSWLDRIVNTEKNRHQFSAEFNQFLISANLYRNVF